ncbi:hypothetical protein DV735_g1940, partial [Chaetothyriales sp. CBS 134920]
MSTSKSSYSESRASDTDFRRTWDKAEYAEKAKKEQESRREEAKARYEAKLEGKKWHKPVDVSALEATTSRGGRVDVSAMVGKSTLACDLTYKDNVQFVDHLNSKQHLIATGQSGEVKRATLAEVRERIAWLKERKRQQQDDERKLSELDIQQRIRRAEEDMEREREEKRRKRNEKRRAQKGGGGGGGGGEQDVWEGRLGIIR